MKKVNSDSQNSKKKEKKGGKRINKQDLTAKVIEMFNEHPNELLPLKIIFRSLRMNSHPMKMLCKDVLDELCLDEYITEIGKNVFQRLNRQLEMTGIFHRKRNGKNFFVPDEQNIEKGINVNASISADAEEENDTIFIAERNASRAMEGDRVRVALYAKRHHKDGEGEVIEILERAENTYVGTLEVTKNFAFLVTEDRTLANDIFIPKNKLKKGVSGDKVIARVTEWPERAKNPTGEVIDVLGKAGENNTEMHAILAEFGLPYQYPANVEAAADLIPAEITPEEIAKREDYREPVTFTIDPKDAKDFDDALSLKVLDNGNYEVGVHIADVSHYVPEGGIIDKEAVKRATSIYLVDRTIPMLPERLCNFICSLRQDEEKLAYSVIFEIDKKGQVINSRIKHTVINSNRRFTYEEAQEIIETGEGEYKEEILAMNNLAQILREQRFKAGAINFDRAEVRFNIDEKGKPLSVYIKVAKEANKLVEEFMLLANRTVASQIGEVPKGKKAKVLPYRIHDVPDPDKIENLQQFIARFGYKLNSHGSKTDLSKSINSLLDTVQGKKEENLVETIAIRSMAKAIYSTHNVGHYGLGFRYYTHFTSPIRRYPDLMVHRLLTRYLDENGRSVTESKYEDLCKHSSDMEQLAAKAERTSIKYKQVEFLQDKIGEVFDGVISGVTEWGLYVELNENKCEGMIPCRDLDDDYYELDQRNYCLRGRSKHRVYSLGDPITIRIARANLEKKIIDFALEEKE
ncbi:MAG: ribonuclease R [Bacteroidaceae bacterium]